MKAFLLTITAIVLSLLLACSPPNPVIDTKDGENLGTGTASTETVDIKDSTETEGIISPTNETVGEFIFVLIDDTGYGVKLGEPKGSVLTVPDSYCGKPVIKVLEKAFYNATAVKEVRLPDTVIKIGENAFSGSGVEKVVLPDLSKWYYENEGKKYLNGEYTTEQVANLLKNKPVEYIKD